MPKGGKGLIVRHQPEDYQEGEDDYHQTEFLERVSEFPKNIIKWEREEKDTNDEEDPPKPEGGSEPSRKRRKLSGAFDQLSKDILVHTILPFVPKPSFRLICKEANDKIRMDLTYNAAFVVRPAMTTWWSYDFQENYAVTDIRGLHVPDLWSAFSENEEARSAFIDECMWLYHQLQIIKDSSENASIYLSVTFSTCTTFPLHPVVLDAEELLSRQEFIPIEIDLTLDETTTFPPSILKRNPIAMALHNVIRFPEASFFEKGTKAYDEHFEEMIQPANGPHENFPPEEVPIMQKAHRKLKHAIEERYENVCVPLYRFQLSEGKDLWLHLGMRTIAGRRFIFGYGVERYDY